ncbi:disulfide bond formation protein B [Pacificibacter marinus]|uniref:Disulfide bond formation protein B n=1 Tax=Pacificibacter marinus TaxID=658057 RepID=A0A1Y5TIS4_9RHOB|nr:disulfide bond formation protein B [Pacificibacter marinus]SEL25151.1 Disulfide bond formation protein DsbB [Pacificibacter marinus]SLN64924.1 disulfide bond formation protein B [Pacificibacter marinus]
MKNLTRTQLVALAAGGSLALLLGAFFFQALGYAPCKMCLWQRWPHVVAIFVGAAYMGVQSRVLLWFGALAAAVTAGLGAFHTGVERKWWEGPTSCTGGGDALSGLTGGDLLPGSPVDAIVMCDQVSWEFLGLSMASYNFAFSALLVAIWLVAARKHA